MKILFFTRSFYPRVGGVEKHVYEISTRLVKLGHEVTIVTEENKNTPLPAKSTVATEIANQQKLKVLRIPITVSERKKKFQIWKWLWHHQKLIKEADIIHAHDVFFWYLPFRILFPIKKIFITFHGYESYPIKKKAIIYRKLFELLSSGSICVGDFMKKWYFASPTVVTYGAVNLYKTATQPQNDSAIFIGRLDDQTGIDIYVEAVKLIRKKIPDFTLTIYGDGPYKEKINKTGVILKGFNIAADKEIGRHQIAFISRYLAILEAMATKRLVFAVYDNAVKEDYLKMTPFKDWIISCSNPQELAKKVVYYLNNGREADEKIKNAYRWVKVQTWENLTEQYLFIWKKKTKN